MRREVTMRRIVPGSRRRMRQIAAERRRFGHRRIGLRLQREGMAMSHQKLHMVHAGKGLAVKYRHDRRRGN